MGAFYREFQRLMHRTFITERKHDAQAVAQKLGISPRAFYGYIEGERTFPLDLLPDLFLATREIAFLNFCVRGTGYTLAKLPEPAVDLARLESETLDVATASGDLCSRVRRATSDGCLSHTEREEIEQAVIETQRQCEEVRAALGQAQEPKLRAVSGNKHQTF